MILSITASGQQNTILKCSGNIPEEFIIPPSEKAARDLDSLSLDASKEKSKRQFYIESNYLVDRLLKSGRVLFNDSLSAYISCVADKILVNEPALREELRFYVVKSPYVNAFSTDNGIIFINLGLIAHLENEAQLAFVLCHEIAHYTEGHSLEGYLENLEIVEGRGSYQSLSLEERLIQRSNFSKTHEYEADREGFERFKKTGYHVEAANTVFYILQFSHLPFDQIPFEKSFLENANYNLPKQVLLKKVDEIELEESDDEYSTHPNASSRRAKLDSLIKLHQGKGSNFQVSEKEFSSLQKLSRYEMTRLYLIAGNYSGALYNSFLLEKKYPGEIRNKSYKALALMALATYKAQDSLFSVSANHEDIEGESQQLCYILEKLSAEHLSIIATANAFASYRNNPKNSLFKEIAYACAYNLFNDHELNVSSFGIKEETELVLDTLSEIDRSKLIKTSSDSFYYALNDYIKEKTILDVLNNAQKAVNDNKLKIKSEQQKEPHKEQDKSALNIDKIVFLQPFYIDYSERRNKGYQTVKSENSKMKYVSTIEQISSRSGLNVHVLSPSSMKPEDVDQFNDYAILNDWTFEAYRNQGFNLTSSSFELGQEVISKYGTQYIAISGIISIDKSKREDLNKAAIGFVLFYTIPIGIYFALRPQQSTYFFYTIYDIKTGKTVETYFYNYSSKDHDYIVKSSLYDALLKTKNL